MGATGGFQHPQARDRASFPRIGADELAPTPLVGGVIRGDGSIGVGSEASRSDEIILLHQNSNWARRGPGQKYPLFILLDQKERLLLLMADDTPVVLSWLLYRYLMRISASRRAGWVTWPLRAKDLDDLVLELLFCSYVPDSDKN